MKTEPIVTRDPATVIERSCEEPVDCSHCGALTQYLFGRRDDGVLVFAGRYCGVVCFERAERAKGLR